jgi:hypothetical protein
MRGGTACPEIREPGNLFKIMHPAPENLQAAGNEFRIFNPVKITCHPLFSDLTAFKVTSYK